MHDLPLQVRLVDDVRVDDADSPDARRGEVERRRRAEPAGADQQDLRVEQLQLPLLAHLRDQKVAAVARAALGVEPRAQLHGKAVPLPVGEPAGERHDVVVAELRKRLGREGRAVAGRAVDDDGAGGVRGQSLDPGLEMTARYVDGSRDVTLVPLVLLADVDDDRLAGLDPVAGFRGVDLRDLGPHLLQELSIVRHRYRKYSFAQLASVAWDERACQGLGHRGARRRGRCGDSRRSHARHAERCPAAVEQATALRAGSDSTA